jgi:hypothetical protein
MILLVGILLYFCTIPFHLLILSVSIRVILEKQFTFGIKYQFHIDWILIELKLKLYRWFTVVTVTLQQSHTIIIKNIRKQNIIL